MFRIKAWIMAFLCLLSVCASAESEYIISSDMIKNDVVNYETAKIEIGTFEKNFSASAKEYYPYTYSLRFDQTGARVREICVSRNDKVKQGDVLAVFDLDIDEVTLTANQRAIERTRETLATQSEKMREAISEMEQGLLKVKSPAEGEILKLRVERAELELEQYIYQQEVQIDRLEKEIAEIEKLRNENVLLAPADGVIVDVSYLHEGELVYPSEVIATLYRTDGMMYYVDNTNGAFHYGMEVDVEVGSNRERVTLKGRVVGSDLLIPTSERRGYACIVVENPDNLKMTRPSAIAPVVYLENVPLLTRNAVKMDNGEYYVSKLSGGVVQKRFINGVFNNSARQVWVLQGIDADDEIIVD